MTTPYILHAIIWAAIYTFLLTVGFYIFRQAYRDLVTILKDIYHALRPHRPKHLQADSPRDKQRAT